MTREIKLSQGKVALVDDADFEWLSQWKWSAAKRGRDRVVWYAVRVYGPREAQKAVLMHRAILNLPPNRRGDHRDCDGLNNQRANLRECSPIENAMNARVYLNKKSSRFKGIWYQKQNRNWVAEFRRKHIGCFATEEDAARAYDDAAFAFSPEFARLNFSDRRLPFQA